MSLIGIIGAMAIEVEGLIANMTNITIITAAGIDFHSGDLDGKAVVVVGCGVGKVNAAMCAQALLDRFECSVVINLGVAGAIHNSLNIKDVVVSRHLVQHDFDVTAGSEDTPQGHIPRIGTEFAADEALVKAALAAAQAVFADSDNKAHAAVIATGDQFIADKAVKQRIADTFGAYCVEMEGGAIAQVCQLNGVPFVVIRAISDRADGSAEVDFMEFVEAAAANSTKIVINMIASMPISQK